jgi:hypothetical protein
MLKILRQEGFDAVRASGGTVAFGVGPYQLVWHVATYAPRPYQRAMRMARFVPVKDFTPPQWAPNRLSVCGAVGLDVLNAFASAGSLFDAVYGRNERGTFNDVLKGLRDDPNGPQVDVRREVIGRLGQRLTLVTDSDGTAGPYSERVLVAVEAREPRELERAIRRLLENDEEVRRREFRRQVVWEILPPRRKKSAAVPAVKPPNSAVAVAHGQLFVTNNVKLLEKVLGPKEGTLAEAPDYKRVATQLGRLAPADAVVRSFSRGHEEFRTAYEALRQGRLAASNSLYARLLDQVVGLVRDGSAQRKKLPPFDRLRPYLGPTGLFMNNTDDGWLASGFTLKRDP